THYFLKGKSDQVQAGHKHVSLDANLTLRSNHSSGRHFCAQVTSFLNGDFARADVYHNAAEDDEHHHQDRKANQQDWQQRSNVKVFHDLFDLPFEGAGKYLIDAHRGFQFATSVCEAAFQDEACAGVSGICGEHPKL